jgi:hypothetical protein
MEPTKKHSHRKLRILLPLFALFLIIGISSAAVFTMFYTTNTATVKSTDVQLAAGTDSTASPTEYPAATVTVAATKDFATVAFSLFPSASNTPQPQTFYTDLLHIVNNSTNSHTIKSISISSITGASNLGNVTIYYYAAQTDTPDTGTPIASISLTSSSTGTISLFSGTQTLPPTTNNINYIEIEGHASATAATGSTVTFTLSIQWT